MSLIVAEVYDAFRTAGVPEEQARRAAEACTVTDTRFDKLEARMEKLETRMVKVERDLAVLKWMVAATFAGVLSLVLKAFL